jgi:tetratricopeptide (TPR) repeat protein
MVLHKKIALSFAAAFSLSGVLAQNESAVIAAYSKSMTLEKNKDYKGAIEVIKTADPSSYEANLRLGWLNYKAGQQDNSLACYEKAISLAPASIEAKFGYNYPAYELGNMDVVIAQYTRILEMDPLNTQALYNLGSIYYYKNDLKNALSCFDKIVALYPFGYDGLNMLAWTNLKLEKTAEAKALFEKVLRYAPSDATAAEQLAVLKNGEKNADTICVAFAKNYELVAKSDYKGAIAALSRSYDKSSYEMNERLGWLNYSLGLHKEAIAYYKTAIALKPKSIEARFGIVYPLAALGNSNELVEQYQGILAIDAQNSLANYRMGYINYEKKDYAAAQKYFEKVVKYYPWGYDGLLMHSWNYLRQGKNAEAKAGFQKVLLLAPGDKSALEGLALIK